MFICFQKSEIGPPVNSVKLEEILSLVPENIPVVIKVDVEGSECKVNGNMHKDVQAFYF